MYVYIRTHAFVFIYLYTHMYYRRNPSEKSLRKLRFIYLRQTSDLRRTADRVENIVFARIRLGTHLLSLYLYYDFGQQRTYDTSIRRPVSVCTKSNRVSTMEDGTKTMRRAYIKFMMTCIYTYKIKKDQSNSIKIE